MLVSDSEDFFWLRHQDRIKVQIDQILSIESPISKSLLCKRVLMAWGITRLGSRINAYFESIFTTMGIHTTEQRNNTIFWKGNGPESYRNYRIAEQDIYKRDADELPAEEVANGVLEILRNQISLSRPDLIKEAARLFGFARIGANVEIAMSLGIQKAVDRGNAYIKDQRISLKEE